MFLNFIIKYVHKPWALVLSIIAITLVTYSNTIFIPFVNFDDNLFLFRNYDLERPFWDLVKLYFTHQYGGHYHPLNMMFFVSVYKLFQLNAVVFHLIKLAFHLANILLLFKILEKLKVPVLITSITTVLFALTPVNVETVTWISAQGQIMYSFFFLFSVYAYLRYIEEGRSTKFLYFSAFLFLLSLLSKSSALTFPLILILIEYVNHKTLKISFSNFWKHHATGLIPFFILSFIFGIISVLSAKNFGSLSNDLSFYTPLDRILIVTHALMFYIQKLLIPTGLSIFHLIPDKINNLLPWDYYLSPFILILIGVIIYRFKSIRKELLFGFLFFFLNIILVANLVIVGGSHACERYAYLPSIGFYFMVGALFFWAYTHYPRTKYMGISSLIAIVLLFSILSYKQNKLWGNTADLFDNVTKVYPNNPYSYFINGGVMQMQKNYPAALECYNKALELTPNTYNYMLQRAVVYKKLGEYDKALADFKTLAKLKEGDAYYYVERSKIYKAKRDYVAAMKDISIAISMYPDYIESYIEKGTLFMLTGQPKKALSLYNELILKRPLFEKFYFNRANIKVELSDFEGAYADYNKAIEIKNDYYEAFNNRGLLYLKQKRATEAIMDFSIAIQIDTKKGEAYNNRGVAYYQIGNIMDACMDFQKGALLKDENALINAQTKCR